jgi:hypothetical protein
VNTDFQSPLKADFQQEQVVILPPAVLYDLFYVLCSLPDLLNVSLCWVSWVWRVVTTAAEEGCVDVNDGDMGVGLALEDGTLEADVGVVVVKLQLGPRQMLRYFCGYVQFGGDNVILLDEQCGVSLFATTNQSPSLYSSSSYSNTLRRRKFAGTQNLDLHQLFAGGFYIALVGAETHLQLPTL